jgi:hypothetical protein
MRALTRTYLLLEAKGHLAQLSELTAPSSVASAILLERPRDVLGSVELDEEIDPRLLEVELSYVETTPLLRWLRSQSAKPSAPWPVRTRVDANRRFSWTGLPPGTVSFRFRMLGSEQVVFESTGNRIAHLYSEDRPLESLYFNLRGKLR